MVDGQYGRVLSKPIPGDFLDHGRYRFNVIVNPTRRDSASRKLVAIRSREEVAEWFAERAVASWGFVTEPEHLQVNRISVLQFKDKQQRQVTIGQSHIQGVIRITDKEQFTRSFTQGIGRARAYGCGLLQVVPVIDDLFA